MRFLMTGMRLPSIDYNVMHVDIVNTIRIMTCSGCCGFMILEASYIKSRTNIICYKHNINNIYS